MAAPQGCPGCGTEVSRGRCPACGLDVHGPTARELARVDRDLERLLARRRELVGQLGTEARWQAPPASDLPLPPPPPAELPPLFAPQPDVLRFDGRAAGPQVSSILLSLGTGLLVVASLVFAAVSWNRIGALGQGALLLGLTAAAGMGTHLTARRQLPGTSEALGVLTVLLGPLVAQALRRTTGLVADDLRTWSNWGSWTWWPVAVVIIGAAAIGFGRLVDVRSPQVLGTLIVQVALPLWTVLAPLPTLAKVVLVGGQAVLVGAVVARDDRASSTRAWWWAGAGAAWAWALVAAATMAPGPDPTAAVRWPLVSGLVVLALYGAALSWAAVDRPVARDATAFGGLGCALVAVALFIVGAASEVVAWPASLIAFGAAAVVIDRCGTVRRGALAPPARSAVALASLPVVIATAAVLGAAADAAEPLWATPFGAIPDLAGPSRAHGNALSVAVSLSALAAVAWLTVERAMARTLVRAAGVIAVLTVPVLSGLSVGAVTVLTLAAAAAATVFAAVADRSAVQPASWLLAAGLLWSLAGRPLTIAALALVALGALAFVVALGRDGREIEAAAAMAVGVTAALAELAVVVDAAGVRSPWPVASVATVAALALVARPRRGPTAVTAVATAVLVVAHLAMLSLLAAGASDASRGVEALTGVLAVSAAAITARAAVAHGDDPSGARWLGWVALAGGEVLWLVWFRLAEASVSVLEAYTLPLAALVTLGALLVARWTSGGDLRVAHSWALEGGGLAVALWPTALVALGDPGVTRQVVGLLVGAVVLTVGATARRRAPLDVGGATVALLGLQAALPYLADVPRWISLGAVGAALVALGATFERRRQDLDDARRRYATLH